MARPSWVLCGALVLLVALAEQSWAHIHPTFWLESCAWHATDIVLVQLHAKSTKVEVEESWRGSLAKGAVIEVEGLSMSVDVRAVLFLKHPTAKPGDLASNRWMGAGMRLTDNDVYYSMVWMNGDSLYAVQDTAGGGTQPEVLTRHSNAAAHWPGNQLTLADFKQATLNILAARDELVESLAIPDAGARLEALEPLTRSKFVFQRYEASAALSKLGPEAVPTLKKMLREPQRSTYELARAMASAAGPNAAAEMAAQLQEQLEFWTEAAPTLPMGWRDNRDETFDEGRRHEAILFPAMEAVRSARYAPARDVVAGLRKVWAATPALAGRERGFGIIRQCDLFLQELDDKPASAAKQ